MQIKVYMGSNQLSGHFQPAVVQWLRVIELFQRGFDRINLAFFVLVAFYSWDKSSSLLRRTSSLSTCNLFAHTVMK